MRTHTRVLSLIAALVWVLPLLPAASSPADGFTVSPQEKTIQAPKKPHPGPKDIKEQVAIYVFLGWLWLSILVLIYVLRLKIRESDRLNNFAYFDTDKKSPPAQT